VVGDDYTVSSDLRVTGEANRNTKFLISIVQTIRLYLYNVERRQRCIIHTPCPIEIENNSEGSDVQCKIDPNVAAVLDTPLMFARADVAKCNHEETELHAHAVTMIM